MSIRIIVCETTHQALGTSHIKIGMYYPPFVLLMFSFRHISAYKPAVRDLGQWGWLSC